MANMFCFYLKPQQHLFSKKERKKKECVLLEVVSLPGSSMRSCFNFFTLTTSYQNSNKLSLNSDLLMLSFSEDAGVYFPLLLTIPVLL